MKFCKIGLVVLLCVVGMAIQAQGEIIARSAGDSGVLPGGEIAWHTEGTTKTLTNAPDYNWWYGCSPTSAGMMLGYYDRNGYGGFEYGNLAPGGIAEATNSVSSPLADKLIASAEHVNDFYRSGYLGSGDDLPAPHHAFNSLADFMGTSQDSVGNVNGSTTFWNFTNGAPLSYVDALNYGIWNSK